MPKKILNLNNFSGGLNEKTTPRDIGPNEFQRADNMNNEIPGKLTLFGESVNGPYTSDIGTGGNPLLTLNHGNGLYKVTLDRDVDDESIGPNQYLFINDSADKTVRIIDITNESSGSLATKTIVYGNNASMLDMYTLDGTTRIVPTYVSGGSNTNKPKVFEYYNYSRKLGTSSSESITSTAELYSTEDMFIAPLRNGSVTNYSYDPDTLHDTHTFRPNSSSEVYLYANPTVNSSDQITNFSNLTSDLANYAAVDGRNYSSGYGSMAIMAHFSDGTADADGGAILVSTGYRYGLFCSLVYKNQDGLSEQESYPTFIGVANQDIEQEGTHADKHQKLFINLVGRLGNKANRVAGFKVYWSRIKNFIHATTTVEAKGNVGAKYLLFEVDYEKGLRLAGKDTYSIFREMDVGSDVHQFLYPQDSWNGATDNTSSFSYLKGAAISELSVLEPYTGSKKNTSIGRQGTTFKTSVMINRRLYVGNVSYYDDIGNLITKNDRVLKSMPNKFDYFPSNSFLDVAVEDGDEIVHLATVGSKLLQFKKRKLFIVNCQRDLEFVEADLDFKGCEYSYHVVSGPGFVAWINRQGAYMYDGQRLYDLDISKSGQARFDSFYGKLGGSIVDAGFSESQIAYLPESKELIIVNPSGQILKYDMKSESWSEGKNFDKNADSSNVITRASDADLTNLVTTDSGQLFYAIERNGSSPNNTVRLRKWNNDPAAFTANGQVMLKTKEYDMESPSVNKSITTVYINYKRGENILIRGFATRDGSQVTDNLVSGSTLELSNTTSEFKTQKINVSNSVFKHVNAFGLELYADSSGTVHKDFAINDIQIVFREKVGR